MPAKLSSDVREFSSGENTGSRIFNARTWHPSLSAIVARFMPQAWQGDYAVPVDEEGPTEYDVTDDVLKNLHLFGVDGADDSSEFADHLRSAAAAPEWIREWRGPFEVYFRTSLDAFHVELAAVTRQLIRSVPHMATGGGIRLNELRGLPLAMPKATWQVIRDFCLTTREMDQDLANFARQTVEASRASVGAVRVLAEPGVLKKLWREIECLTQPGTRRVEAAERTAMPISRGASAPSLASVWGGATHAANQQLDVNERRGGAVGAARTVDASGRQVLEPSQQLASAAVDALNRSDATMVGELVRVEMRLEPWEALQRYCTSKAPHDTLRAIALLSVAGSERAGFVSVQMTSGQLEGLSHSLIAELADIGGKLSTEAALQRALQQRAIFDWGTGHAARIVSMETAKSSPTFDQLELLTRERDAYRQTLEIIGVGDAPDPVGAARAMLEKAGFWQPDAEQELESDTLAPRG